MAFCGSKGCYKTSLRTSLTLVPKSPESRVFPRHTHQIKGCSSMVSRWQQGLEARCVAGTLLSALCGTHRHHQNSLRQKVRQSQQLIISTSKCISRPSCLTVAHLDETPAVDHGETVRATFPTLYSYFGLSTLMPVRMLLINEGSRVTIKTSPVCLKQLSIGQLSSHINGEDSAQRLTLRAPPIKVPPPSSLPYMLSLMACISTSKPTPLMRHPKTNLL